MSEEIIKVLDDLGERFGVALDWSSENVMPMVEETIEQLVRYNIIMSIISVIIGVFLIIVCPLIMYKIFIKCDTAESGLFLGMG